MENEIWDKVSEDRIKELHPLIREKVRALINQADKAGIRLRVVQGLRTWAQQQKIFDQGRSVESKARGEKIVTNARPGDSFHNYGLAIDVVPIEQGKANFNTTKWAEIARIGKSLGFFWGGDFKNLVDKPHFEMTFKRTLTQVKALYNSGKKDGDFVTLV